MKRLRPLAPLCLLASFLARAEVRQPEAGLWRPASNTARSVTGEIGFSETRITLNFAQFTLAEIRSLTGEEAKATFNFDTAPEGAGSLYRVAIPADSRFLHHNTLCGSEAAQWIVTWVHGKSLSMALFSGNSLPKLTAEAVANTTALCGTYTYVR